MCARRSSKGRRTAAGGARRPGLPSSYPWAGLRYSSWVTGATYFYATAQDAIELMDYLGVGSTAVLRQWPLVDATQALDRAEVAAHSHLLVIAEQFGELIFIRDGDPALSAPTASGLFNQRNLAEVSRLGIDRIVNLDASPVLMWNPGSSSATELRVGSLGTQATSPQSISADYDRWVKRVASWIWRRGTVVWGLKQNAVRPDLDIDLRFVNSVYALPGALDQLVDGVRGR